MKGEQHYIQALIDMFGCQQSFPLYLLFLAMLHHLEVLMPLQVLFLSRNSLEAEACLLCHNLLRRMHMDSFSVKEPY